MTDILQLLPDPLQRKLLSLLYYTGFLHLIFLLGGGGGGGLGIPQNIEQRLEGKKALLFETVQS